jgi:hypothetical protein
MQFIMFIEQWTSSLVVGVPIPDLLSWKHEVVAEDQVEDDESYICLETQTTILVHVGFIVVVASRSSIDSEIRTEREVPEDKAMVKYQ